MYRTQMPPSQTRMIPGMDDATQLLFSTWLDTETARLHRNGEQIPLTGKAFALLSHFVANPHRILTTSDLLEAIWPNRYVNDSEVRHYVRVLRQALADDLRLPRYIETVRGRGYRFIGALPTRAPGNQAPSTTIGLVGRARESAQLTTRLQGALDGEPQAILITGDPGVGKTTLVSDFAQSLEGRGNVQVASGYCVESYGQGEPYTPVLAALDALCQGPIAAQARTCLERYAPLWLLQLPSQLASIDQQALARTTIGASPARMLREIAQALSVLTSDRCLVLWLEDLHWADASTIALIDYLARSSLPMRLLLIGTTRPLASLDHHHPLVHLHTESCLSRHCHELALKPFGKLATTQYVDARYPGLPAALGATLHRHTGGNPLFIAHVLEDLHARKLITEANGHWTLGTEPDNLPMNIPENLRGLIRRQFTRLEENEQRLLTTASVAGMEFTATLLARVLNWTVEEVENYCADLVQRNSFLRAASRHRSPERRQSARYSFNHALNQQALYDNTTPACRRDLHRAFGLQLEELCTGRTEAVAAQLAWHFEQSGDIARAVKYHREAARVAMDRQAKSEAHRHRQYALSLLQSQPESAEKDRQVRELAYALNRPSAVNGNTG